MREEIKFNIIGIVLCSMFGVITLISALLVLLCSPIGWVEKAALVIMLMALIVAIAEVILHKAKKILMAFDKKQRKGRI